MKRILSCAVVVGTLGLGSIAQMTGHQAPYKVEIREVIGKTPEFTGPVVAVTLNSFSCKYSINGKDFQTLKKSDELPDGAVIRTGMTGGADLFLKRMGATIRLKGNTEISLAHVEKLVNEGKAEQRNLDTTVNVRKGSVLTVVHAKIPGSTLEIKNPAGRSLKDTVVDGRYSVSASSIKKEKPVAVEKEFSEFVSLAIREQLDFDEIESLGSAWSGPASASVE